MKKFKTHYDNLQVSQLASDIVIRAAFRGLSQKHHPDKNLDDVQNSERVMKIINEAYTVLSNPKSRKEHDEWIKLNNNLYSETQPKQTRKTKEAKEASDEFSDYSERPNKKTNKHEFDFESKNRSRANYSNAGRSDKTRSIFDDIEAETVKETNHNNEVVDAINPAMALPVSIIIGSLLLGYYLYFKETVDDVTQLRPEPSASAQQTQYDISKDSPEPLEANPQQSPITNVLNNAYSGYSDKKECWIAQMPENNLRYCVKIDNEKIITHNNIKRYYIMTRGIAIDENENDSQMHSLPGMVGSFVLEERNNKLEILASDSKFYLGSYGTGPEKWTLVKLGPDNYWGWQNISGDCHQGYCGNRFHLLAPFKKEIRDLAGFISNYDSSGTCSDSESECSDKISLINTDIKIDSSKTSEKIFPLQILVSGKENGQIIEPYLLNLNFDRKKWTYPLPNDYLMNDKEY